MNRVAIIFFLPFILIYCALAWCEMRLTQVGHELYGVPARKPSKHVRDYLP